MFGPPTAACSGAFTDAFNPCPTNALYQCLDQTRALMLERCGQGGVELFQCCRPPSGNPILRPKTPSSSRDSTDPACSWPSDRDYVHLLDRIRSVRSHTSIGEDNCGHVQIFARLGPEGLQGVHAAAVCLQINHLPIWACNCRTGCVGMP